MLFDENTQFLVLKPVVHIVTAGP